MTESCQQKKEDGNGVMLDIERLWYEEKSNKEALYPTLHIRELAHGMWSLRNLMFTMLNPGKVRLDTLSLEEFLHLTFSLGDIGNLICERIEL